MDVLGPASCQVIVAIMQHVVLEYVLVAVPADKISATSEPRRVTFVECFRFLFLSASFRPPAAKQEGATPFQVSGDAIGEL